MARRNVEGTSRTVKKPERHGKRFIPEYQIWLQMKARCQNPRNKKYADYGGRGISVCDRWNNSFQAFYDDMGPRPSAGLMLDRIDNNKGYFPDNCKWSTRIEQMRNRRNNRWISFRGQRMLLPDWAAALGVNKSVLLNRIYRYGWTFERALTTPVSAPRKNCRFLTFRGETMPMIEWARKLGIRYVLLKTRMRNGWSVEDALTTPVRRW